MGRHAQRTSTRGHVRRATMAVAAVAVTVAGLAITSGADAAAPTVDANAFATDPALCGAGTLALEGALKVRGGSASFAAGGCTITMGDGAKLTIKDAELSGTGDFSVSRGGGAVVKLTRSTLTMDNVVKIEPGYQSGDGALVRVDRSTVTAYDEFITASTGYAKGRVTIKKSTITATVNGGLLLVSADESGKVKVGKSTLTTDDGNVIVTTGANGSTRVVKNSLAYSASTIHSDGECLSKDNDPETPCE
jgi:hypothetical protein